MVGLTIFTPAYNRAHTIEHCYNSLKHQTFKNFEWLIVDDGSTDNTEQLVRSWQEQNTGFVIRYYYKENGGLHTAYNTAIKHINTELAMCIDSDDWLTDNAVELALTMWEKAGNKDVAGIAALDSYADGKIIGDNFPEQERINLIDLLVGKYSINNGDRKLVIRSDLYKAVAPMPSFGGEKNFNPHYMHLRISQKYDFLVLNRPLCIVEYQTDGMSNNIYKQYLNSPNSFAQLRRLCMEFHNAPLKFKVKNAIHYVSSCLIARKYKDIWNKSSCPILTSMMILPGIMLTVFIRHMAKNKV